MFFLLEADLPSAISFDVDVMNPAIKQAINRLSIVSIALLTSFIGLKLGYEYFKKSVDTLGGDDMSKVWDWHEIVRVILLTILIGVYTPLAQGIVTAIRGVNEMTAMSPKAQEDYKRMSDYYYNSKKDYLLKSEEEKIKAASNDKYTQMKSSFMTKMAVDEVNKTNGDWDGESGSGQSVEESNEEFWDEAGILSFLTRGFSEFTSWLAGGIKGVVGVFSKIIFSFGLVIGPLAIAFSVLWKEKLLHYFTSMLTLGFVFTTMNVLQMVSERYMLEVAKSGEFFNGLAVDLAVIACYLSAFKLTNLFVGKAGLGGVASRAIAVGAGAVAAGVGAVAMVASKGKTSGGAGNIAKMGNSVKD